MKCSWRWWCDIYDVQLPLLKPWFNSWRCQIHSLIAMKLACRKSGGGGLQVSWLLQNGGSWGCGNSGAGVLADCWGWVVARGRGRDRKPDFVACSAWIVSGWVVVTWDTESYSGLAGNIFFIPGFESVSPGNGSD